MLSLISLHYDPSNHRCIAHRRSAHTFETSLSLQLPKALLSPQPEPLLTPHTGTAALTVPHAPLTQAADTAVSQTDNKSERASERARERERKEKEGQGSVVSC